MCRGVRALKVSDRIPSLRAGHALRAEISLIGRRKFGYHSRPVVLASDPLESTVLKSTVVKSTVLASGTFFVPSIKRPRHLPSLLA